MQTTCTNIWNLTVRILLGWCHSQHHVQPEAVASNITRSLSTYRPMSKQAWVGPQLSFARGIVRVCYPPDMYKSFSALFSPLGYYETPTGLLFKFYDWKSFLRILTSQALTYSVFSLGDVPMRPLGCFQDKKSPSRPLPELIFTDNDPQSTLYSGFNVQSDDWQQYMPELICRFVIL